MGQISNMMHHLSKFQQNWTGGEVVTPKEVLSLKSD